MESELTEEYLYLFSSNNLQQAYQYKQVFNFKTAIATYTRHFYSINLIIMRAKFEFLLLSVDQRLEWYTKFWFKISII